ncbi:hypothetical protein [Nitratireductor rhodophyticola]|nr:hypothetical protein [Nitratireductor rhodophyticola]
MNHRDTRAWFESLLTNGDEQRGKSFPLPQTGTGGDSEGIFQGVLQT